RRCLRPRVRLLARRLDRRAQDRQGRPTRLAGEHRSRGELTRAFMLNFAFQSRVIAWRPCGRRYAGQLPRPLSICEARAGNGRTGTRRQGAVARLCLLARHTADRNLEHQQNLTALPISVVVLVAPTNRIESLAQLVPELLGCLQALPPRRLVYVGA